MSFIIIFVARYLYSINFHLGCTRYIIRQITFRNISINARKVFYAMQLFYTVKTKVFITITNYLSRWILSRMLFRFSFLRARFISAFHLSIHPGKIIRLNRARVFFFLYLALLAHQV